MQNPAHTLQTPTSATPYSLAVTSYGAEFPRKEMIRWPRAADGQLAVFQLLGGTGITILVFLDRLGIDQVGNIDQHAVGIDALAADLFL